MSRKRSRVAWFLFIGLSLCGWLLGCKNDKPLEPSSLTFAELRVVRSGVSVQAPGESLRAPYARQRLVDGTLTKVEANGLAWLRRDDGALFLVRGPAEFRFGVDQLEVTSGRMFVSVPPGIVAQIQSGERLLRLANTRVSLEATEGQTGVYVLRGEVTEPGGKRAGAGEQMVLTKADVKVEPQLVWQDWTGGLATTDQSPAPPPFGVGTIGARPPGDQGAAREALAVERLALNVKVDGEFAVTEVDQSFFNAASKRVEGIYRFRTPPGATLLRFGVDRGDSMVWGRIKEKASAAAQYASNVYEGSTEDPALLEWVAPGEYQARLYPIEPGASRRVVVRYSEWLPRMGEKGERRLYTYPMAAEGAEGSLPHIEEFTATFDLARAGAREVRSGMGGVRQKQTLLIRAHDFIPRADLSVELFDSGKPKLRAYRANHVPDLAALAPETHRAALESAKKEPDYLLVPLPGAQIPRKSPGLDLSIVVDSSAATEAANLALAAAATEALLEHLGAEDRVAVWTGADGLRPLVGGRAVLSPVTPELKREAVEALASIQPGGATDLGLMLSEAAAVLEPERAGAVVYIGDGAPTVGELSLEALNAKLARLPRPFRVFAFGTGEAANLQVLDGIANGGFAERLSDRYDAAQAALRLLESAELPTALGLTVSFGPDVERVYPRGNTAITLDQGLLVIGRLVGKPPKSLTVKSPEGTREIPLTLARLEDHGDLRQRWAGGRLRELLDDGVGRAALVDLGMRYGIVTPTTSLYVPTAAELATEEATRSRDTERNQPEEKPEVTTVEAAEELMADDKEGGQGTRAKADEGAMAKPAPPPSRRYAEGPQKDSPDPQAARAQAQEGTEFGMIGQAPAAPAPPPSEPELQRPMRMKRSPTAAATPGSDVESAKSAKGNTWGDELAGAGEGGGGLGDGIGLGGLGTFGHGAGTGTGQGFGAGHGRLGGSHKTTAPKVRMGAVTVSGRLPPEVIQRIVRQNFGRFRLCYEQASSLNPNLEGRVGVRFVIDRSGAVSNVADAGSTIPDSGMIQCVMSAFQGLSFPQPEGGVVSVVYPIEFSEGGGSAPSVEAAAQAAPAGAVRKLGTIVSFGHTASRCGLSASLPLAERAILWRERLGGVNGSPTGVAHVYRQALANCEASDWRSRSRLFSAMLDALPEVRGKVELWRTLWNDLGARDALYRGILARVKSAEELRELHDALGLASIDPAALTKLLEQAKDLEQRVRTLRELRAQWPDDLSLHLVLLETLEDAGRFDAGRELAEELRARPDATTEVRTNVGEFYLRLSERAAEGAEAKALAERDLVEAKRSFGEIVEFAPNDPVARRRLGDLLRAHGWFDEARRQYETLAQLLPDDPTVGFLVAAAARGQGRLEEALGWLDKAAESGDPESIAGPAAVGRALSLAYLAWGRDDARKEKNDKDAELLENRADRVLSRGLGAREPSKGTVRVTLIWTHPDFHPTLWTNALGSAMPAPSGDITMGVSEAVFPRKTESEIEVRLDETELERMSRFGAEATLTVVFDELDEGEKIVRVPVRFQKGDPPILRFKVGQREVTRG
jgi:tetratricopeptide (TPR) repeat protein